MAYVPGVDGLDIRSARLRAEVAQALVQGGDITGLLARAGFDGTFFEPNPAPLDDQQVGEAQSCNSDTACYQGMLHQLDGSAPLPVTLHVHTPSGRVARTMRRLGWSVDRVVAYGPQFLA